MAKRLSFRITVYRIGAHLGNLPILSSQVGEFVLPILSTSGSVGVDTLSTMSGTLSPERKLLSPKPFILVPDLKENLS